MRFVFKTIFKVSGWKIVGSVPSGFKKYILAVGPHTSNWDFPLGIIARSVLCIRDAKFIGKSSLFHFPYGWFFRMLGGYPVERSKKQDMTSQVADIFNKHENFIVAIAPEGTRKKTDRLRTGFWYIAKKADIPVIPFGIDYRRKEIVIGETLWPGDDIHKDLEKIVAFYKTCTGKNPKYGL